MYRTTWMPVHSKEKFIGKIFSLLVIVVINLSTSLTAMAVGLIPVPTLKNVTTQASATYDPVKQWYSYHYSVDNPATNTGEIWDIKVDISRRFIGGSVRLNPNGLTIPLGATTSTFIEELADYKPPLGFPLNQSVISIGQRVPAGWAGGFGRDGYAGFHTRSNVAGIVPSANLGGFVLISPGLPTIRKMQIIPDWMLVVPNLDEVTEAEKQQAGDIERKIIFHTHTLGPAGVTNFGGFSHWNLLRDDIEKAVTLGWVPDTALAGTIRTKLAFARKALDAQDGTLAKSRLQTLLATMQAVTPGQKIRREAYDLIVLNIQSLLKHTANTPIPFEPAYSLTPPTSTLSLGKRQTLIARAFNVAFNNAPIPSEFFEARITEGPHIGMSWFLQTDANGEAPFSYVGKKVGKDHIIISRPLGLLKKKPVMLAFTGNLNTLAAGGLCWADHHWVEGRREPFWRKPR
ncbi:MAG: hypothetical protein Q9M24_05895 [Mariprofundaceae bacterium]|nr:hypothetical protein [Mariprofundaceae bacterium]